MQPSILLQQLARKKKPYMDYIYKICDVEGTEHKAYAIQSMLVCDSRISENYM
jgi:hypothetical protein